MLIGKCMTLIKLMTLIKTKTKMLVPLDSINGQKMLNYDFEKQIAHFIHGHLAIDEQVSNKIFLLNGCKKIILYNNITIKEIKLGVTYPSISLTINHHFMLQQNTIVTSTLNTQVKIINQNLNLRFGHISMILNNSDIKK